MQKRPGVAVSAWVIIVVALIALGSYVAQFYNHCFSEDPAEWGQFGDYMGGILNPIVAFGAFLWLVASVKFQKQELTDTKTALERSQEAQQQQADTSLLAAQIETMNIQLSRLVAQTQELRTKQMHISELQNRPDHPHEYVDEHNRIISIRDTAAALAKEIEKKHAQSDEIVEKVKTTSEQFRQKVHSSYSNN